jgi:endonuclease YncB( thermonuclease family)
MVRAGWALADRRQSDRYVRDEEVARRDKVGLWVGAFEPPTGGAGQ